MDINGFLEYTTQKARKLCAHTGRRHREVSAKPLMMGIHVTPSQGQALPKVGGGWPSPNTMDVPCLALRRPPRSRAGSRWIVRLLQSAWAGLGRKPNPVNKVKRPKVENAFVHRDVEDRTLRNPGRRHHRFARSCNGAALPQNTADCASRSFVG